MNLLKSLLFSILLLSFYSCSPRIVTTVTKKYPKNNALNVTIFSPGEAVPNSSEIIGNVKMSLTSTNPGKRYQTLLQQGRIEAAKAGGNGFMITNYANSNTYTVLNGNILYLRDMIIDNMVPNRTMQMEDLYKNQVKIEREKYRAPKNTISFNVGLGVITSKLYTSGGLKLNPLCGLDLKGEYNYTFANGVGAGILYSGFLRTLNFRSHSTKLSVNYVAPIITYSFRFNRFITRVGYGMGIAFYDGGYGALTCFGANIDLKFDYMLNDNLGLNISTGIITCILPDNRNYNYESTRSGIQRMAISGGMSVYF